MSDLSNDMLINYINPIFGNTARDFPRHIIETVSWLTVMRVRSHHNQHLVSPPLTSTELQLSWEYTLPVPYQIKALSSTNLPALCLTTPESLLVEFYKSSCFLLKCSCQCSMLLR